MSDRRNAFRWRTPKFSTVARSDNSFSFIISVLFLILCLCCKDIKREESQLFKVGKHNVGYVNDSTQVKDLKTIFAKDSIVNYKEDDSFIGGLNPFEIFEKNGNHLLSIYPFDALDSTSAISHIQIKDSRFRTEKDISNQSYFIDIKKAYSISEVKNKLETITVEIDSIKLSFVFAKKQLNRNFEFGTKIDVLEIPDSTKVVAFFKHF